MVDMLPLQAGHPVLLHSHRPGGGTARLHNARAVGAFDAREPREASGAGLRCAERPHDRRVAADQQGHLASDLPDKVLARPPFGQAGQRIESGGGAARGKRLATGDFPRTDTAGAAWTGVCERYGEFSDVSRLTWP
eukprot:1094323-Prymnesium_polylepis.2